MADLRNNKTSLLYVLLGCSLLLNAVLLLWPGSCPRPQQAATVAVADPAATAGAAAPQQASQSDTAAPAVAQPTAVEPQSGEAQSGGWTVLGAKVEQSLARTFQLSAGQDGDALASVFTRLFVWDVDMRRDLNVGDSLAAVWRKGSDGLPEIAAGSLQCRRLGKPLAAYRWQAPGDQFPSYWHLDGTEAPLRLKDGPIAHYEQITSLLKDRPTHKGMDFKTPVGTEVTAPRAGTVTRANWNWNANGNCIEIRYDDGVLAKFLHLSANRVKEGDRVSVGQLIALSGNTGHSTAPHLHYQLNRGDAAAIDPLDYHGTVRRSLNAEQLAALRRDVAGFEKMIEGAAVP